MSVNCLLPFACNNDEKPCLASHSLPAVYWAFVCCLDAIVLNESFRQTLSDIDSEFAISLAGTRANGPGMTQTSNPWPVVVGGIGVGGVGAGTLGGVVGGVPGGPEGRPLEANPPNVGSFVLGSTNFFGQSGLSGPRVNFTGPEFIVDGQSGRLPPKSRSAKSGSIRIPSLRNIAARGSVAFTSIHSQQNGRCTEAQF
jgi:hypothetical protein